MQLMRDYSADKAKKKSDYADKKYLRSIVKELKTYGFSYVMLTDKVKEQIKEQFPNAEFRKCESFYEVSV